MVAAVSGALALLGEDWNWQQFGAMTPAETAQAMRNMLAGYLSSDCAAEEEVPTPYWDDSTDLDDEEPGDEQSWYGIFDGEFHETVENFIIAGFIAYSGQIGAAVTFLTFAPKFRLAWKKGGLGGAIRIFIDGVDNGLLDTYSEEEGVIERDFVGDPELSEHVVLQVLETLPV